LIGGKLRDLAAGFAVEQLQPEVVHIVVATDGIDHPQPVRSENRRPAVAGNDPGILVEHLRHCAKRIGL